MPARWREAALALAGMAAGASMAVLAMGASPASSPRQAAAPANAAAHRAGPANSVAAAPAAHAGSDPVRLSIPSIGVDAPVETVGLKDGAMDVPKAAGDVGWYQPGVRPGAPGDSVLDGHLDWTTGPAVFWRLAELKPGDQFQVKTGSGTTLRYVVFQIQSVPYDRPPADLFAAGGPPRLSLITCAGPWDSGRRSYEQRLVVDAVQLAVT